MQQIEGHQVLHNLPWISSKRSMMQGVESIVIGDTDVRIVIQQQWQDIVAFLADGIVKGGVTFRIL